MKNRFTLYKLIVSGLAFLLYSNTLNHDFALDDKIVITYNSFTKKGIDGINDLFSNDSFVGFFGRQKSLVEGGRYRPLSMAYYALVWEFMGPKKTDTKLETEEKLKSMAHFLHFSNALFYAITAYVLMSFLLLLFKNQSTYQDWAFFTTLLFIAHPLHTEVVANIKSLDEILAFLLGIIGLTLSIKYVDHSSKSSLFIAFICFLGAFFAKESIVTFIGVLPLCLWFFRSKNIQKSFVLSLLPILLSFTIYMLVRQQVLGDLAHAEVAQQLMNKPFMHAKDGEKIATVFFTAFIYFKLLLFPHPLTHDYYPWHPLPADQFIWGKTFPYPSMSHPYALLGLLILGILLVAGLLIFLRKKAPETQNILAFSVLFFVGTYILFSNLFFDIGAFMNERFMYIPSLGFSMALAWIIHQLKFSFTIKTSIIGTICLLYSFKTIHRNRAWENDQVLAITDVETSVNSAKVNMSAGGAYYELAKKETSPAEKSLLLKKSKSCLERSLQLYPDYIQSKTLLGHSLFEAGDYVGSCKAYELGLTQDPNFKDIENAILYVSDTLKKSKKFKESLLYLEAYLKHHPTQVHILGQIGEIYGKDLGDLNTSESYLQKAYQVNPKNNDILIKLGVVQAMQKDFKNALNYFTQALAVDSTNKNTLLNLGITYMNLGDKQKGEYYIDKSK